MSTVKLVAVFAENKLGLMARVTQVLAEANVNIRWVTIATSGPFGVIKLLVDKCEEAFQGLKQRGFPVSWVEVLAVEVPDKPGGLHAVAQCLSEARVNLENSSGFVSNRRAVLLIELKDLTQAQLVLEQRDLKLLTQTEILSL
jgi:hypothetical protein